MVLGPSGRLEVKASPSDNLLPITAIVCHPHPVHGGTMENKVVTSLFRTFRDLGAFTVRFNYRGVGRSEGEYAEGIGESDDLQAVIRWSKIQKPEHALILAGFSFGTYVVARVSQSVHADYLITLAPPVHHYDFDHLRKPRCPWLVIQGEQDEIVPTEQVIQWVEKQKQPPKLVLLPDTGHFFHGKLLELRKIVEQEMMDFFHSKKIS